MALEQQYRDQVALLLRVLPLVGEEKCFALKGGTALNLFLRDMPRLSVDIDLAYLPNEPRDQALARCREALDRIRERVEQRLPGCTCANRMAREDDLKLVIQQGRIQVKVELSPVLRGTVHPPEERDVSEAVEEAFGFASVPVVSVPDLYGGKICAALDRQHPRDFFDIKLLLENEGVTREIFEAFLVYLISHPRPMAEVLAPNWKPLEEPYNRQFVGMTRDEVTLEELKAVGPRLLEVLAGHFTPDDAAFLLSFKAGQPDWDRFPVPAAKDLPAAMWKLRNIGRMSPEKHEQAQTRLKTVLEELAGLSVPS